MPDVTFADLTRAIEERTPDFAERVIELLEQPDPPEDRPEDADEDADASKERPPLPPETWTLAKLKQAVSPQLLSQRSPSERKTIRREAFEGLLAAPYPPPRIKLGALLPKLYEEGDEWGRSQLIEIFKRARIGLGLWQAFKTVFKLAEVRHDAPMFGVLAYRLDAYASTPHHREISPGTQVYMRRRAWRYLRQLGQAVPELFPTFAGQVLMHYPASARFQGSWVANQIWAHAELIGHDYAWHDGPPDDLDKRAYNDAWKTSEEPLLRLIEDADNDVVCNFAIRGLKRDFPEALRSVDAAWLRRIGRKPSGSVHAFIVDALTDSPEFHQSRLKSLGLHRTVLDLLRSSSEKARNYAIRYAEAHASDLEVAELVELTRDGANDVRQFAIQRLTDRSPADIGLSGLITLSGVSAAETLAVNKIRRGFRVADLEQPQYLRLATGRPAQRTFVQSWYETERTPVPAPFLLALLEHREADRQARRMAVTELDKRTGEDIGMAWFKRALLEPSLRRQAATWLTAGKLTGDALDVDWLKGLVVRSSLRSTALTVLGNIDLVAPDRLGLPWLLTMVRHRDEAVHRFAHRYLLENVTPEGFEGIDRLWSLATDAKEPDPVRRFAAAYLKAHHPQLGPKTQDASELGIKPRLTPDAYALARVRPLFVDERPDVRALAVAIARYEIVRWDDRQLLFELAASRHREPRNFAAKTLGEIRQDDTENADAEAERIPPASWLAPAQVFALTESPQRSTRDIAMRLLANHYMAIGGPQRLAWLMESPERDVRTFAVRLLWQQHRPRRIPVDWAPPKKPLEAHPLPQATERFDSMEALHQFLTTVMFGLPPGRRPRADADTPFAARPLPASIAKLRLIDVIRDLALEDEAFARLVVPIFENFVHSVGKSEWQACVSALARIRRAHPTVAVALNPPVPMAAVEVR